MAKKKPAPAPKSGAEQSGAEAPEAEKSSAAKPGAKDDALHEAFRAALERKNAKHESHPGTGPSHLGVGEAHNDRQRRQFRRKSG